MASAQVKEIHFKTLLNRMDVPLFPFRWTLNPYRGCRHACRYCYSRPTHEHWGMDADRRRQFIRRQLIRGMDCRISGLHHRPNHAAINQHSSPRDISILI